MRMKAQISPEFNDGVVAVYTAEELAKSSPAGVYRTCNREGGGLGCYRFVVAVQNGRRTILEVTDSDTVVSASSLPGGWAGSYLFREVPERVVLTFDNT